MTWLLSLVVSTAALLISPLEPNSQSLSLGRGWSRGWGNPWKEVPKDRGHLAFQVRARPPQRNSHPYASSEPCDQVRQTEGWTDRQMQEDCRAQDWDRVNEVKDLRRHRLLGSFKGTVRT